MAHNMVPRYASGGNVNMRAASAITGSISSPAPPGWPAIGASPELASVELAPSVELSASNSALPKTVSICDTQPVMSEGVKTLLESSSELRYLTTTDSLRGAMEHIRRDAPGVLLMDKAFGIQALLDWLGELRALEQSGEPVRTAVVVWGVSVTEAEALRFLQAGARGILRKTAGVSVVLACLRTVSNGRSWMEDCVFRDSSRGEMYPRSELTAREQQVLELVEQGFKNKEIATELGIRPGTVKIHLKHIFEKTGVRGRYGLALNGLKERGLVSVPA
jgi:two-component system nitrate/nitrite response regulator NarL